MRRRLLFHVVAIQCLAAPFILAFQDGRMLQYLLDHGADAAFAGWVQGSAFQGWAQA